MPHHKRENRKKKTHFHLRRNTFLVDDDRDKLGLSGKVERVVLCVAPSARRQFSDKLVFLYISFMHPRLEVNLKRFLTCMVTIAYSYNTFIVRST